MTRRAFVPLAASAAAAGLGGADAPKNAILELRYIRLRNSAENQRQRSADFLQRSAVPALQRAGAGPIGVFASAVAPETPFLMMLVSYPSLAAMEQIQDKVSADREYQKALESFNAQPGLSYERMESMLLRAFDAMPQVAVPPVEGPRARRLFEVRMYESNNSSTLARKIKMFESGEIAIFKRLGMQPVFFGRMIVGPKMPNLVYMLAFDDMAAREKAWRAFGGDPEWKKLRETPGWSDAEIVSNISNFFITPLLFCQSCSG
jgi:hypothetical protein